MSEGSKGGSANYGKLLSGSNARLPGQLVIKQKVEKSDYRVQRYGSHTEYKGVSETIECLVKVIW